MEWQSVVFDGVIAFHTNGHNLQISVGNVRMELGILRQIR